MMWLDWLVSYKTLAFAGVAMVRKRTENKYIFILSIPLSSNPLPSPFSLHTLSEISIIP